jgi:hypothetical protein
MAEVIQYGALIAKAALLTRNASARNFLSHPPRKVLFELSDASSYPVASNRPNRYCIRAIPRTISKPTKDAFTAKKARGMVLGTPANTMSAAIAKSLGIRQKNARTNQQNQQAARLGDCCMPRSIHYSKLPRN